MKYLYIVSFLSLFLINNTHAEVPFTWMYFIYAVTHPAYHHLSPLHGMISRVEQMYRDGDKLTKELFYLQEDNVSFRPTILKSKPASYWTPHTIGMIIAAITVYREDTSHEDKDHLLRTTLERIMQPQQEIMRIKEKDITAHITTQKKILQDITQQSRKLFTLIGQTERKRCTTLEQLNQRIAEIEQLEADQHFLAGTREPIEQDIKKLKYDLKFISRALENGITDLISYCIDSVKENAPDDYTTEHILLTLLWKIANPRKGDEPKQDFVDYFNQLGGMINTGNLQKWITAQPYSKNDCTQFYEHLKTLDPDACEYYLAEHYEQAVLAQIGRALWESPLPPIITGAGALYTTQDGNKAEPSPDCVETSFRIFFNIVLYNTEKKMFDIERLCTTAQKDEKIPLNPNTNFINFYHRHKCVTNLQASELYDAWADVLTNLPGTVYMKPNEYAQRARFYEVKSFFPNMLKICNHLLFGNNYIINQLPPEKQLDILCDTISRDDFAVSWDIVDEQIQKNMLTTVDYVTLKFLINDTHSFEWHLKKGHSVIPRIDTLQHI